MLRISLGGPGLEGFPRDSVGGYVKLQLASHEGGKPLVRTYTVRHFDPESLRLDVDFVMHASDGPAADWARRCNIGDPIRVGGPGPAKPLDAAADWVLIAGDMSALPAIAANIENLPRDMPGIALIEIIDPDDRQPIDAPERLDVRWLVNATPDAPNTVLLDAVRAIHWRAGRPHFWVAGEFSQSLAIRQFLKKEKGATRDRMYASSYWQIGQTEDGHRISKRNAAGD